MDYKSMKIEDIINWCKANNEVEWLKANVVKPNTYFQIKKAFCLKFMPEIMPKAKAKKASMYDLVANL